MSKTWKEERRKRSKNAQPKPQPKPQKAVDRLLMREAKEDIQEALRVAQGAPRGN